MHSYDLSTSSSTTSIFTFRRYLSKEWGRIVRMYIYIALSTMADVLTPLYIAIAIDEAIGQQNPDQLIQIGYILAGLFVLKTVSSIAQVRTIAQVSHNSLTSLRRDLFATLQRLPMRFFVANTTGDLISRINNDSFQLNETLSFTVARFFASFFAIIGISGFIFFLHPTLATITMVVAFGMFGVTRLLSPWIRRTNKRNSVNVGKLSSSIEENIYNFRVIVTFDRRDFFRDSLTQLNSQVRYSSFWATISSGIVRPLYDFGGQIAQLVVLLVGINFAASGDITIGFLVAFIGYTQRLYEPLSLLGYLWTDFQRAIASWSRVSEVLELESDLEVISSQ